jgi:hypothetical protein
MKHEESAGGRSPVFWAGVAAVFLAAAVLFGAPLAVTRLDLLVIAAVGLVIWAAGFGLRSLIARQRRMTRAAAVFESEPPVSPFAPSKPTAGAEPILRANPQPSRDLSGRAARSTRRARRAAGRRRGADHQRGRSRRKPAE